ncbi:MAG: ATP-binding protein [Phycisphaerales bacterium]
MPPSAGLPDYEKLGAFYLGREHDLAAGRTSDAPLLYDSKDLCTHAVCVGMTGSGKTGLCVSLLEEAAIDGVPAIVIDPKGDLANMMLGFPDLKPEDFRPWVEERAAQRKGMSVDEYAADRARLWQRGLADWDQDGERIRRLHAAADFTLYTPGSDAARSIALLRSFDAPPAEVLDDRDAMRERVQSSVSGLLALLGIDADPIRSREHILLSNILERAWRAGRSLDAGQLVGLVQAPGFDRIGVMDLEAIYPASERFELAMALNNLLASPGFGAWMEGEPLDVSRLLYSEDGRPRVAILSIAHLSDAERMFFVTRLLGEVVTWMRRQPGTGSLRALLYMDEVFGFLPPTANPPSKMPMLTLLKQARAYGVGCVLATQNPVDLDYKALSNAGTWFIGRLQTERDKMRVLDGLEGASATSGVAFDRGSMEQVLAGLGSRVFLMHNVHEDGPAIFHTRWAMSYLAGPMTRQQIARLSAEDEQRHPAPGPTRGQAWASDAAPAVRSMADATAAGVAAAGAGSGSGSASGSSAGGAGSAGAGDAEAAIDDGTQVDPPPPPPGVDVRYLEADGPIDEDQRLVYRPAIVGRGSLHYVRASAHLDAWEDRVLIGRMEGKRSPWEEATVLSPDVADARLRKAPEPGGRFAPLPRAAERAASWKSWKSSFADYVYRHEPMTLWSVRKPKLQSEPGEERGPFVVRLRDAMREERDRQVEKLRNRYAPKLARLEDRVRKAEQKIDVEEAQFKQAGVSSAVSMGAAVLGAIFGRKVKSVGTVGRAGSAVRSAGRAAQQRGDIKRAEENLASLQQSLADLEAEFQDAMDELEIPVDPDAVDIKEVTVRPRKGDIDPAPAVLVWLPYAVDDFGQAEPRFDLEG